MLALELASILCDLRTPEEARKLVDYARAGTTGEDFYLLLYEGKTLAALGDVAGAERTASRAVELASETDDVDARGDALVSLAKIRAEAESPAAAVPLLEEANELFERKGDVVSAGRARELAGELATEPLTERD